MMKDMFLLARGEIFVAFLEEATDMLTSPISAKAASQVESCLEHAFVQVGMQSSPLLGMFAIDIDHSV